MRRGPAIVLVWLALGAGTASAALPVEGARENITDGGGRFVGPFETTFRAAGSAGVRMRTSREADSSTLQLRSGTTVVQVVLEVQCVGGTARSAVASVQRSYRVMRTRRGPHRLRATTLTAACPDGARLGGDAFSGPARGWLCLRRASGAAYAANEFGGLQVCRRYRPAPA